MLDASGKVSFYKIRTVKQKRKAKNLEMLPNECIKTYKAEEQHVEVVFVAIERKSFNHAMQTKKFKKYFLADFNLIASYD